VDKVEDSGLKFFGSDCEHSPVRRGGEGDTVLISC